jgi:hypothetical protein
MEQGKRPKAIASEIGIARQSVHRIAKRVDEAYKRDTLEIVDRIKTEQALRLELIADEAMAAWHRSIESDAEKITVKRSAGQERNGEISKTTTKTPGNAEYLRVAMDALKQLRLLFGVGTDGKENGAQPNGVSIGIGINGRADGNGPIVIKTRWATPAELGMMTASPSIEAQAKRIEDQHKEPDGPHSKWNPNEATGAKAGATADKARGI